MKASKTVLVVEDEADLREILCYNLEKEGYACHCLADGGKAIEELRHCLPDLIILDRMLPTRSGDDVARHAQRQPATSNIPIILLTAKGEESDQLVGFALGAIDYVTKPFSMKVLLARVAAALRRTAQPPATESKRFSAGPISLDEDRHEVTVSGRVVSVTSTEFKILRSLMAASGRVLDRNRLIDAVLGPTVAVTDRTVDVHIAGLRKKLLDAAGWVQTVRGVGYTFRPPQ
jgi:two-component system phosphate regulon response regulator PhoB